MDSQQKFEKTNLKWKRLGVTVFDGVKTTYIKGDVIWFHKDTGDIRLENAERWDSEAKKYVKLEGEQFLIRDDTIKLINFLESEKGEKVVKEEMTKGATRINLHLAKQTNK